MRPYCVRNFTLVEMLVVIAIIGILAALLMPALQKAIDSAHMVNCANNQKQIGFAFGMYAGDWNGHIMRSWEPPTWGTMHWPPFLSGRQGPGDGFPNAGANGPVYLQKGPGYMCPKSPKYGAYAKQVGGGGWASELGYGLYQPSNEIYTNPTSYWNFRRTWNPNGTGVRPYINMYILSRVSAPSTLVLLTDTITGLSETRPGAPASGFAPSYALPYNARIHLLHGSEQANALFFDFHVSALDMYQMNETRSRPKVYWFANGSDSFTFP